MKTVSKIIFIIFLANAFSCSPLVNKIKIQKPERLPDFSIVPFNSLTFDYNNFFVFSMTQSLQREVILNNDTIFSDFDYHAFSPVVYTRDFQNQHAVDETYLYLHDIHQNQMTGVAIYFVTQSMIKEIDQAIYLNDPDQIYSGIIRSIRIGHWERAVNGQITLLFHKEGKPGKALKVMGHKGWMIEGTIEPPRPFFMDRSTILDISNVKFKKVELNEIHKRLENQYIHIENVLNLEGASGLYFQQIGQNRRFVYEKYLPMRFKKREVLVSRQNGNQSLNQSLNPPIFEKIYWRKDTSKASKRQSLIYLKDRQGNYYKFKRKKLASILTVTNSEGVLIVN